MDKKILVLKEHNHYYYGGCHKDYLKKNYVWEDKLIIPEPYYFKDDRKSVCFNVSCSYKDDLLDVVKLETTYYIGLQYVPSWKIPILVEPKVNNSFNRLDFLGMLTEALKEPENFNHLDGLMAVDYESEWIEVPSTLRVELTPFIIVQFLMAVKQIVKKGLKKSYYSKTENLKNKIKGKVLVGQQIKENILQHKIINTVCSYQEFGFDTEENQFIKYVLQVVNSYIDNFEDDFKSRILDLLHFNFAPFYLISDRKFKSLDRKENNPFYKVYNNAFELGNQILKLISHSYQRGSSKITKFPPHWIDMSKLFELYTFKKLREKFTGDGEVKYHTKANYQELDFIIDSGDFKAVVDAKYKPRYQNGNPSKEDARQLSGYSRLNKIYKDLKISDDTVIPVYFIYPSNLNSIQDNVKEETEQTEILLNNVNSILLSNNSIREVKAYRKMYMQEVSLNVLPNL